MQTERVKVAGMTCRNCTTKVQEALTAIPGVSAAEVSLSSGEATVHYDERLTAPEQMKSAVRTAGYQVDAVHDAKSNGCCCS